MATPPVSLTPSCGHLTKFYPTEHEQRGLPISGCAFHPSYWLDVDMVVGIRAVILVDKTEAMY